MYVIPLRWIGVAAIGILAILGIADACNWDWAVTDIFNKVAEATTEAVEEASE